MMSDVCKHCVDAPCVQSCPTGSLIYNEYGNVYVQADICNGCGYCVAACPFGVIARSAEDGHAHKCTLCYDRQKVGETPACAKSCPTASIQFGPVDKLREHAKERVETLKAQGNTSAYLYGADDLGDYGKLNSFFLLEDHPNRYNLPENPPQPLHHQGHRYAASLADGPRADGAGGPVFDQRRLRCLKLGKRKCAGAGTTRGGLLPTRRGWTACRRSCRATPKTASR